MKTTFAVQKSKPPKLKIVKSGKSQRPHYGAVSGSVEEWIDQLKTITEMVNLVANDEDVRMCGEPYGIGGTMAVIDSMLQDVHEDLDDAKKEMEAREAVFLKPEAREAATVSQYVEKGVPGDAASLR